MNSIEFALVGRIGRDPELKHSQSGNAWTSIGVGVGKDEATQWVRVSLFGEQAEQAVATLKKGASVYIEGHGLRLDSYTTQTGEQRHGLKAVATKVELVGAGAIGRNRSTKPKAPPEGEQPTAPAPSGSWRDRVDAEIPFLPDR